MSSQGFLQTVLTTFLASIKSVGTACTLASVGIYLHQRGFVVGNGKRTLALISQQVTIPLLFFTKILYCNQDWSPEPCPNVTDSLKDVWILLVWPLWVCTAGICVGHLVTKLAGVPSHQKNSILASVAFGNSTGLPITLLTVIHTNFGPSSAMGLVDPTLFLSVYLVLYPVLQWGIGGMLLAAPANPQEKELQTMENNHTKDTSKEIAENNSLVINPPSHTSSYTTPVNNNNNNNNNDLSILSSKGSGISSFGDDAPEINNNSSRDSGYETDHEMQQPGLPHQLSFKSSIRLELDKTKKTLANNVIHNNQKMPQTYQIAHRGLDTTDASLYWSVHENLNRWGEPQHGMFPVASGVFDTFSGGGNIHNNYKNALASGGEAIGMDMSENDHAEVVASPLIAPANTDEEAAAVSETSPLLNTSSSFTTAATAIPATGKHRSSHTTHKDSTPSLLQSESEESSSSSSQWSEDRERLMATFSKILKRCFQPPVIAALLGLLFASFPAIRGVLVDIDDRDGSAPLQWFFDGLFEAGRAAVPINMIILGCNLSASYMLHAPGRNNSRSTTIPPKAISNSNEGGSTNSNSDSSNDLFGTKTTLLVVFGKMIVMPLVGYASTLALSTVYTVSHEIAGSLYLVLSIVFLCPTANNVMVMVELGGGGTGSKESMARIIAYQYALAPLVLSGTVTGAVLMASSMAEYYRLPTAA